MVEQGNIEKEKKYLVRRMLSYVNLFNTGVASMIFGAGLMFTGGYNALRTTDFFSSWLEKKYESVYTGEPISETNLNRFQRESERLAHGSIASVVGFGMIMGGLVSVRYVQKRGPKVREPKKGLPSYYDDRGRSRTGKYDVY